MKYKGYELMQAIAENKLKLTQVVSSTNEEYQNCTIEFVLKNLAIYIMNLEFELIEDKEEIDIQEIEELENEGYVTTGRYMQSQITIKSMN